MGSNTNCHLTSTKSVILRHLLITSCLSFPGLTPFPPPSSTFTPISHSVSDVSRIRADVSRLNQDEFLVTSLTLPRCVASLCANLYMYHQTSSPSVSYNCMSKGTVSVPVVLHTVWNHDENLSENPSSWTYLKVPRSEVHYSPWTWVTLHLHVHKKPWSYWLWSLNPSTRCISPRYAWVWLMYLAKVCSFFWFYY